MTLVLSNNDIEQLLSPSDCISLLEQAYLELDAGRAVTRPRTDCLVDAGDELVYSLKTLDAVLPSAGVGVVRINSDLLQWPTTPGGGVRREKLPRANGEWVGLVLAFSTQTGEPLAIFPDGLMQRLRVAATTMLAQRYLVRDDAANLAVIGTGWQAGAQLSAAFASHSFRQVTVFSPNVERRETFAKQLSGSTGAKVMPADSADAAANDADVILCATSAASPVVQLDWVRPGVHISTVKLAEMPAAALPRLDLTVVHTNLPSPQVNVATGIRVKELEAADHGAVDVATARTLPQLVDLLSGRSNGRATAEQATCFINNNGLGIQFAPLAAHVYQRAVERGVGNELPTSWFTESVHP
jgi:ornithine cyclodeaminase/alanine dehydrogenase-like protein (mu-crystallin family)